MNLQRVNIIEQQNMEQIISEWLDYVILTAK